MVVSHLTVIIIVEGICISFPHTGCMSRLDGILSPSVDRNLFLASLPWSFYPCSKSFLLKCEFRMLMLPVATVICRASLMELSFSFFKSWLVCVVIVSSAPITIGMICPEIHSTCVSSSFISFSYFSIFWSLL